MIEDQVKFEKWKSKVDFHLEEMTNRSMHDFSKYDYLSDFKNNVPPNVTATRAIKRGYKGATNGSGNVHSKTKR
jgi:hypothetical protein